MRLCLVEDLAVAGLEPLTLTRPVYELRLGGSTLGAKIARAFGVGPGPARRGAVIRTHLAAVQAGATRTRSSTTPTGWPAGRCWWPTAAGCPRRTSSPRAGRRPGSASARASRPVAVRRAGRRAVAWRPTASTTGSTTWSAARSTARRSAASGSTAPGTSSPRNERAPRARLRDRRPARRHATGTSRRWPWSARPTGSGIHETARIDPYTVFDTTNGPIIVGPGVWVQPFTRIEGPCFIGRDTQLFRANLRGAVTIGPNCRIGGEVEASIVHGYSNKYHEGFLGHAYIGEWVNLGAITSNSDLRNDYGEVHGPVAGRPGRHRARRRSAASSATTPGPAWAACSTPARRSA